MFRTAFARRGTPTLRSRHSLQLKAPARPRTYAQLKYPTAGGHAEPERSGSDLPWIIGSLVFTLPAVAYLLTTPSTSSHAKHEEAHAALVQSAVSAHPIEKIKEKVTSFPEEFQQEALDSAKAVKHGANDTVDDVKAAARTAYDTTKEKVDAVALTEAAELVKAAKQATSDTVGSVKKATSEVSEPARESVGSAAQSAKEAVGSTFPETKRAEQVYKSKKAEEDNDTEGEQTPSESDHHLEADKESESTNERKTEKDKDSEA